MAGTFEIDKKRTSAEANTETNSEYHSSGKFEGLKLVLGGELDASQGFRSQKTDSVNKVSPGLYSTSTATEPSEQESLEAFCLGDLDEGQREVCAVIMGEDSLNTEY